AVKDEALYVISNGETTHVPSRPVRRFAGWNHAGDHFAYVTPDRIPNTPKESWALLLHADARARDAVYVSGGEADRAVFAGLRATFPRWSPKENKLSVWFTFVPTHRSALSRLLGWGLRPGDPAAIFDPATGTVAWMTVNAFEEAQVGHYHLLKRDYEQAWAWYEKAARGETSARNQPHDFPFFRYICLGAMGRDEDAARELARFRKEFLPRQDGLAGMMSGPKTPVGALLRELYCAEVFLSLDRIGDAEAYFADQPLVLGQLYLLQRRYADYAALEIPAAAADDMMMQMATAFASLPLLCREFLAKLDDAQVEALLARQHDTGLGDLVRRACYRRLGRDKEAKAVRIREQPPWLPADEDYDGLVKQIRELLAREW
ncbi:MAG: hypothetical protein OER88_01850, partial [Planctomycetota bacterium]|nr:hypothetical protein [Planctomycetota bacterium]